MKSYLDDINKAFESRVRLGIMSVLMVEESVDFNYLKDSLSLTDGNLASHLRSLEDAGYILVRKKFVGRKPQTSYSTTVEGRTAFIEHLNALEKLISNNRNAGH